ncbi:MAG: cyclopropane-fatty-acyl-phospholipid synthase family protein [Hyphomicrobiaceae bacterium]
MFAPLRLTLQRLFVEGDVVIADPQGRSHRFGNGQGTRIAAAITDTAVERHLVVDPTLALAEAYMAGTFRITEGGRIYDFIDLALRNAERLAMPGWTRGFEVLRYATRRVRQFNPAGRARRNVVHHYDIDRQIYDLFLDGDRQYSCAYFGPGSDDLEAAQLAKKRHIAAKLMLRPGQRVLDIGAGWGGLGLYLAKMAEVDVTGITLSDEQIAIARDRAQRQGLSRSVRFQLEDYRRIAGPFERIVSVGMFEHVGINHFQTYFDRIRDLLTEDGVALVHAIGRFDGPSATNPFIARYIFPGGYIPALSEVLPAVERSGLLVTDVEVLRLHYAETLRHWRERFIANWDKAVAIRGDTFCRMWEFYLAGSESSFRHQGLMVFQIQLSKRLGTLPLTRDYMIEEERRLKLKEVGAYHSRLAGE